MCLHDTEHDFKSSVFKFIVCFFSGPHISYMSLVSWLVVGWLVVGPWKYVVSWLMLLRKPHFADICFKFEETPVFLILFSINFTYVLKFHFVLVHNVFIAYENVDLVPLFPSVFCYLVHFLENRAYSAASSRVTFPTFKQLPRWPFERIFSGDKFVSAINASKNSSPNKYKKYLWGWVFVAVFTDTVYLSRSIKKRIYIDAGTNIWSFIENLNQQLFLPLFWRSFWMLIIWADKSAKIKSR